MKTKFVGNDNQGKPKKDYLKKLSKMDDSNLSAETYLMINMSSNNLSPSSDWHWMTDACFYECNKRNPEMYGDCYSKWLTNARKGFRI